MKGMAMALITLPPAVFRYSRMLSCPSLSLAVRGFHARAPSIVLQRRVAVPAFSVVNARQGGNDKGMGPGRAFSTGAGAEKPKPQPFAVMRNGHEVIRGMMRDCAAAPDLAAFKETWHRLELWQRLHATTEDGAHSAKGVFAMFDERCNNIASERGLTGIHSPIVSLEQELETQLQNPETVYETIKPLFLEFMEENDAHLKSEEEVMMPCVQQLAKAGANMAEIMQKDVISAIWDHPDFGLFVQYAASTLEKHPEGQPRARVWLHGLMASLPNERWEQALPFVKAGLSDTLFKEIDAEIGMQA